MSAANWERQSPRSTDPLIPKLGWLVFSAAHIGLGGRNSPFRCLGLLALHGMLSAAGTFLPPGGDHCTGFFTSAPLRAGIARIRRGQFHDQWHSFYLMLSPLPDRYSRGSLAGKNKTEGSTAPGLLAARITDPPVLCLFFGGLAKFLGSGWWNGSNLWRSLIRPPFNLISPDILVRFKYALPVLGISICLIEARLSSFHLDQEDPILLAGLHFGNARRNRTDDGNVSVCSCYDCTESGRVRRRY